MTAAESTLTPASPLRIRCDATRCGKAVPAAKARHAFLSPADTLPGVGGSCGSCGASGIVNWERCHTLDPADIEALLTFQRLELIRDVYWSAELPDHILRKARKRSSAQLFRSAELALRNGLMPGHFLEGRQTRYGSNESATIIDCARHATATCCRGCLEKWFGLQRDVALSDSELSYLQATVSVYVERRLEESRC